MRSASEHEQTLAQWALSTPITSCKSVGADRTRVVLIALVCHANDNMMA